MNVDVFPLFSTPLYKTNLNIDLEKTMQDVKNMKYEWMTTPSNGYLSESFYVLDLPQYSEIKKQIQKHVDFFVYDVIGIKKNIEFVIKNSWIVKHEKGNWSQSHFHSNALISGTYYLNVDEDSGKILFCKPNHFLNLFPSLFTFEYESDNNFLSNVVSIQPKNNDLLLFPSHLHHQVEINKSEQDRYCLAFNLFVKGNLSSDDNLNYLELK